MWPTVGDIRHQHATKAIIGRVINVKRMSFSLVRFNGTVNFGHFGAKGVYRHMSCQVITRLIFLFSFRL